MMTTQVRTVSELAATLERQRLVFVRGAPDYRQRMEALVTLRHVLRARQDELVAAVAQDFGGRAREETLLLELSPAAPRAPLAFAPVNQPSHWMRNTGWFGAMCFTSASGASGPTPSKNAPTSTFHFRR